MKKVLLALLIITLFLFGCAKQPIIEPEELETPEEEVGEQPAVVSEPIPAEKGGFKLLVSDQENVVSDFESIEITFSKVKVYKPKNAVPIEQDINIVADLTELQGKNALKILEIGLEKGDYSKIKIYTSKIKGVLLGNEVEIIIPGDALTIEKNFKIKDRKTTTFVFDIEVLKTGKVTTVTGLEQYKLNPVPLKSGTVPADVTLVNELTTAEMTTMINEKSGKKFDRHIFLTREKGFAPPKITIEIGTKVIWENKDDKKLGITMDGVLDTFIRTGGSYEHTFNRAGTYPYNMKYYVSNKGEITVILPEEPKEEEVTPSVPKTIYIKSTGFSPSEISIRRGTKVTFINKDSKNHHLIISGNQLTYNLAPDEAFSTTFNELGYFSFYDAYYVSDYSGKVSVIS